MVYIQVTTMKILKKLNQRIFKKKQSDFITKHPCSYKNRGVLYLKKAKIGKTYSIDTYLSSLTNDLSF